MTCARCNAPNPTDARFCAQCGASLTGAGGGRHADDAGVSVALAPSPQQVAAGGEASCLVKVRNLGTLVDRLVVSVEGPAAAWTEIDPPHVRLMPESEGAVSLRFRPPRSPDTPAGPVEVVVRVASDDQPDIEAQTHGTVEIGPYSELEARLIPQHARGWRRTGHRLSLRNGGNTEVSAEVSATDPDDLLFFVHGDGRLTAAPGADADLAIQAVARRWHLWGKSVTLPFTILVAAAGASKLLAPGTMDQRALVTLKGLVLTLVVVLLILLAIAHATHWHGL